MVDLGPNLQGEFHPEAIRQTKGAGGWLRVNGVAIYATRPKEVARWSQGDAVRYMRSTHTLRMFR